MGSTTPLDTMLEPLQALDPKVTNTHKDALLSKKLSLWNAKLDNKERINACDQCAMNLILEAVEDT